MRKKDLIFFIPVLIVLILTVAIFVLDLTRFQDNEPPAIRITTDTLSVSVTAPEAVLMQGVSATDDTDGDVTALMVVENISPLKDDNTATITYAAFDHAGNVAKATRTIHYVDYTEPVFSLSKPLVFLTGSTANVTGRVIATDDLDGDISRNIKATLAAGSEGLNAVGTHLVQFRVTNSLGDTARITLPVDIIPTGTYSGTIQLKENMVYLEAGSSFRAEDYFAKYTVGGGSFTLEDGVELHVNSDVNSFEPGVYSAAITAQYGGYKAFTRIIVVVE